MFPPPSVKILWETMLIFALMVWFSLFSIVTVQPNPPLIVIITAVAGETKKEDISSETKIAANSVFFMVLRPARVVLSMIVSIQ